MNYIFFLRYIDFNCNPLNPNNTRSKFVYQNKSDTTITYSARISQKKRKKICLSPVWKWFYRKKKKKNIMNFFLLLFPVCREL